MSKDKLTDYDATAGNNTDIGGISVDEGMLPSNVNNALRELMSHLKDFAAGTQAVDAVAVNGDLTVDTNTLHVDSANNRIGINTTSPIANLHIVDSGTTEPAIHIDSASASEGEIAVPTGESFDVGHFDGTTFTSRLKFNSSGDFLLNGLATSVVRGIDVQNDGTNYTTTADGSNKISDVKTYTPVSSTSTVYAIVNFYGSVANDGSDNDFNGRIEAKSTQADGTAISALAQSVNITDNADVQYGTYNISTASLILQFHTAFSGAVAKNSDGNYSVAIFGGEDDDTTSTFSTLITMRAMNVMFIEVEA